MKEILFLLYNVEQLRAYGEEGSAVVIFETENDTKSAEAQYRFPLSLLRISPE